MSVTSGSTIEPPAVAVVATARTLIDVETERSLEELIFATSREALAECGLDIDDIDDIVLSGNDEIDGRVISIMPAAGPAGGVGRDTTMIASSADQGLVYAYLRLLAGQCRRLLVVGWAKPSESTDPDRAELMAAEPYMLRTVGMNHTIAAALQASAWGATTGGADAVVAWPLGRDDLPRRGDSVHVAVLTTEDAIPAGAVPEAWILGAGWTTLSYELGARDMGGLESLGLAIAQLEARRSGIGPASWAFAEIAADSERAVQKAAATLGLDPSVVNPSGNLRAWPTSPHVAGMARMLEVVRGLANLKDGEPHVAAGIGFHGFAGQGATIMAFGTRKEGASA